MTKASSLKKSAKKFQDSTATPTDKFCFSKDAKTILVSHAKRVNYHKDPQDLVSGVANKQGNVVGIFVHGLLDQNPTIIESITKSLGINAVELEEIRKANAKLLEQIKGEIGIATNIQQQAINQPKSSHDCYWLLRLEVVQEKPFIVTGIAGALKKRGFKVGVIKVGGDIRDAVPALYLIKEPIKPYSSIKIGESGWKPLGEAVEEASKDYDFLLVEGAMSAFTGLLNDKVISGQLRPLKLQQLWEHPQFLWLAVTKKASKARLVNTLNYVNILKNLGRKHQQA